MSKNIANFIQMPYNSKIKNEKQLEKNSYCMSFMEQLVTAKVSQINDYAIKQLYDTYKDTDVSAIFIIDMEKFTDFLMRYLPVYLKEE